MTNHGSSIALEWAPVFYQKIGHKPRADAITRFDYDGDWIGENNWEHLDDFELPAYVYFDVKETKSHYFIMYALFHPRDYARICFPIICHENDLEAVTLVINKLTRPIKIEYVQSLAHDRIRTFPVEDINCDSSPIIFFVEPGGHGIHPLNPDKLSPEKKELPLKKVCTLKNTTIPEKKWLKYHIGSSSDLFLDSSGQVLSYQLLPIQTELWSRKKELPITFSNPYNNEGVRFQWGILPKSFSGKKFTQGRARPPWAWKDLFDSEKHRGEWFLDPALFLQRTTNNKRVSLSYVFHEYL